MGSQATVSFESADAAVDTVLDFVNTRFDKLDEAVIPVLSLGATRRFLIRPRGGGPSKTIVAHGGDLVVMGGRCQKDCQHSVPKQKQPTGARLILNFSAPVQPA